MFAGALADQIAVAIENARLYEKLEQREAYFRALFENSAEGVAVLDADGRFIYITPTEKMILGYDHLMVLGQYFLDVVHPNDVALALAGFEKSIQQPGQLVVVEYRALHANQSWRHLEVSLNNLQDSPNVGGIVANFRDITERHQAAEELARREAYFRALIENSAEGVLILDPGGHVRYIAPAEERLTGYSVEEILGTNAFQYIHPDDLPGVMKVFMEGVGTAGMVQTVEYRLRARDGNWRHFEATGHSLIHDERIGGIIVNYRDITGRKQAELALQESQSRLEGIIHTALNGIITTDENMRIVIFNPSAEKIFGYQMPEIIGHSLEELMPVRFRRSHPQHVQNFSKTGISKRSKGVLDSLFGLRKNGEEFPMEAYISQSEIGAQKFFTVILQDITERKFAEDAIRNSEIKFRTLAENIPSVVYQCLNDERYTFLYLNDSIEELTGYQKNDFLSGAMSFYDLYHPGDLHKIPHAGDEKLHEPFHITYRIRHKSGEWRWVDEWGASVFDSLGVTQYIEGVMIDVTDRKRIEDDLRHRAHELETLAAASAALRTAQSVT